MIVKSEIGDLYDYIKGYRVPFSPYGSMAASATTISTTQGGNILEPQIVSITNKKRRLEILLNKTKILSARPDVVCVNSRVCSSLEGYAPRTYIR